MKKNRIMRIASGILVATLLSTCVISGTFAKYVTSADASDSARVAKWGVTVVASGELFNDHYYAKDESATSNSIAATYQGSVDSTKEATAGDNIVAPGTVNTTGVTYSIAGKPEVRNTVAVNEIGTASDIFLKGDQAYATLVKQIGVTADNFDDINARTPLFKLAGGVYVPASKTDTAGDLYAATGSISKAEMTTEDYYPVVYHVKVGEAAAVDCTTTAQVLDKIRTLAGTNDSLETIDKTITITWEWAFYKDDVTDKKDTLLGNLADAKLVKKATDEDTAYNDATAGSDYNLTTGFGAEIVVTQVD